MQRVSGVVRRGGGHDEHQLERPADPRQRKRQDPSPAVPRRQLLRRSASPARPTRRSCRRATRCRPRRHSGPVQLDRVLAALTLQRAHQPADAAAGARRFARNSRHGGARRHPGSQRARADRGPGAQSVAELLGRRVQGLGDRQPGPARLKAPRPDRRRARATNRCCRDSRRAATRCRAFVHTFNATMATLASRQQELSQTISLLPPLLRRTEAADTALDKSFGPTQQFAKDFLPGVKQLDPTIGAALPWIAQAKALVSKQELGGLLDRPDTGRPEHRLNDRRHAPARFVGQSAGGVLHAHADPDRQRVRPGSARHDRAAALPGAVPERRRDRRRGRQLRRQRAVRAVVGGRRRHPGSDAVDPEPRSRCTATRSCPCLARARRTRARPRRCAVTSPAPRTPRRT